MNAHGGFAMRQLAFDTAEERHPMTASSYSMLIRIILFSLAISFGTRAPAQGLVASGKGDAARVVFVCEHGSVKSLIAMVYFNRSAQERGLPYRAVARGTAPEPMVPAAVREGLHAVGFDVSAFVPQLFKVSDVDDASLVVSFDQDIAKIVGGRVRHLGWDNLPGVLADYARGRDEIVRHVDALLDELTRGAAR
jgi:hypothetical protein